MSFTVTHRDGSMDRDPQLETLDTLIRELDGPADPEHPDVAVQHETGWCVSAFPSGLVVWEDAEGRGPERRVDGVSRDDVHTLFRAVAAGKLDEVERLIDRLSSRDA